MKRVEALAYLHRIFDEVRSIDSQRDDAPASPEITRLLNGAITLDAYLHERFEKWGKELSPALDSEDLEYVRSECVSFVKQQIYTSSKFRSLRESLLQGTKMGHKRKGTK